MPDVIKIPKVTKIATECDEIRELVLRLRSRGETVGLVPTMGALHEGHLSLVRESAAQCDHTVVSIFVNPTQFGPGEDLAKYPRTLESDLELLSQVCKPDGKPGSPIVFNPSAAEMYPDGHSTSIKPPSVAKPLEGTFRPDHFAGVATIVLKLIAAVPADMAFFGRKDYQQFKVIESMVRDLNLGIQLQACETVREADGLALSSRNRYLSPSDRSKALSLSKALTAAEKLFQRGVRDIKQLTDAMENELSVMDKVDYAVIVDSETLGPINEISDEISDEINQNAVALIAAHVGGTRLIDNRILTKN